MRVGIVGAGICGLSAARALRAGGHETVLFEKNPIPGGRVATRRQEGYVWDIGATSITPRGKSIEKVLLQELDQTELVRIERPIYTHAGLRVTHGDSRRTTTRYTYRSGIERLASLLAEGLSVRTETTVDRIEEGDGGYVLAGERFDAVVLTPPIPQSSLLLWGLGESRAVANAAYRPCLSVNLGYEAALPDLPYHALIEPEQRHPLTWLSLESIKSPGRAPSGGSAVGAQLSPAFSLEMYKQPDDELVRIVSGFVAQLYGPAFRTPAASAVVRWKYSQPTGFASFDDANPAGTRLVLASDALLGGHIEDAFEVGIWAAQRLMEFR